MENNMFNVPVTAAALHHFSRSFRLENPAVRSGLALVDLLGGGSPELNEIDLLAGALSEVLSVWRAKSEAAYAAEFKEHNYV
jgi:hypothetical protein